MVQHSRLSYRATRTDIVCHLFNSPCNTVMLESAEASTSMTIVFQFRARVSAITTCVRAKKTAVSNAVHSPHKHSSKTCDLRYEHHARLSIADILLALECAAKMDDCHFFDPARGVASPLACALASGLSGPQHRAYRERQPGKMPSLKACYGYIFSRDSRDE